jgi:hypothetical protein
MPVLMKVDLPFLAKAGNPNRSERPIFDRKAEEP